MHLHSAQCTVVRSAPLGGGGVLEPPPPSASPLQGALCPPPPPLTVCPCLCLCARVLGVWPMGLASRVPVLRSVCLCDRVPARLWERLCACVSVRRCLCAGASASVPPSSAHVCLCVCVCVCVCDKSWRQDGPAGRVLCHYRLNSKDLRKCLIPGTRCCCPQKKNAKKLIIGFTCYAKMGSAKKIAKIK